MGARGRQQRRREATRADESDYFQVVASGSPSLADRLFAAWLAEKELKREDLDPRHLKVKTTASGLKRLREYSVHHDALRESQDG